MLELNCKSHLPKGMPVEVFKIFADVGIKLWGGFNLKEADACKAVSQTKIPIFSNAGCDARPAAISA